MKLIILYQIQIKMARKIPFYILNETRLNLEESMNKGG